jgi:2-polyprenyl-6-methoxyphenol hydroxylase-like FAD-dependent oxidoreductase
MGAHAVVYERAAAIGEVGQGLGLFANAVRALDWLGVGTCVRDRGQRLREASTFAPDGTLLLRTEPGKHEKRTGVPSLLMTRPDLHDCLLAALPDGHLATGRELVSLEPSAGGAVLRFADGDTEWADLVVGADGWNSATRRSLFDTAPPRYSGLACWRGIASGVPLGDPHLLPVIQGAGPQFGIGPLGGDRCYWFAAFPAAAGAAPQDPEEARTMLLGLFRGYAFDVERILAATPPSDMLRTDLYDRPALPTWRKGRVTLLGDAAHPMVPTLGQGAAMAIEDAVVLARRLASAPTVEQGLDSYEAERRPRTAKVAQAAHNLAGLGLWTSPIAVGLRNMALRLAPAAMFERMMEAQIGYDAGNV